MASQEIKLNSILSDIFEEILKTNNISYGVRNVNKKYKNFIIPNDKIDKIFDILTDCIGLVGIDKTTGDLNDQGILLDEIAGAFAKIKYQQ